MRFLSEFNITMHFDINADEMSGGNSWAWRISMQTNTKHQNEDRNYLQRHQIQNPVLEMRI
jgi:hypothetical protein